MAVVCKLLHRYVYGPTPPAGVTVAEPLVAPLQLTLVPQLKVGDEAEAVTGFITVTIAVQELEFPL